MSGYSPTHTKEDAIYRGLIEKTVQQFRWERNPNTPNGLPTVRISTGPDRTERYYVGPYHSTSPIKSYVTRNRKPNNNMTLVRIEKVKEWEEIGI